ALAREQDCNGAADSGIAAGDDRGEPFQLAAAAVIGRRKPRCGLEVALVARLLLVLGRQPVGLAPRARLDRLLAVVCGGRLFLFVLAVLLRLDLALLARGRRGGA